MNDDDMIVRDLFAMFALNGMLASSDWFGNAGNWESTQKMTNTYANEAYDFADAMITARDPKKGLPAIARKKK